MLHMLFKLLLIASLLLILLLRNSESLQFPSRRTFFINAVTSTSVIATAAWCGDEVANAAIDVSGLRAESTTSSSVPNQTEVRKIDEPRYAAVRKAQGKGPLFLDGVAEEQQPDKANTETKWMR
jgi:hypothetical protein